MAPARPPGGTCPTALADAQRSLEPATFAACVATTLELSLEEVSPAASGTASH